MPSFVYLFATWPVYVFMTSSIILSVSARPRRQPASLRDLHLLYLGMFLSGSLLNQFQGRGHYRWEEQVPWIVSVLYDFSAVVVFYEYYVSRIKKKNILARVSSRFLLFPRQSSHSLAVWFPSRAVLETLATQTRVFCDYCWHQNGWSNRKLWHEFIREICMTDSVKTYCNFGLATRHGRTAFSRKHR